MTDIFSEKTVLITGGTGSFGNAFIPMLLASHSPKRVIVYSRDEMKQWDMRLKLKNNPIVEFVIGDVRDVERLSGFLAVWIKLFTPLRPKLYQLLNTIRQSASKLM